MAPWAPTPAPEYPTPEYPDFDGEHLSEEHRAYVLARKAFFRMHQKRCSKAKAKQPAKNRLEADKLRSLSWVPLSAVDEAQVGMAFGSRWEAERYARSWAALKGVSSGVKVPTMTHESMVIGCSTCDDFRMVYSYQPATGQWKLTACPDHAGACYGAPTPADGAAPPGAAPRSCNSAFTAKQVARLIVRSAHATAGMPLAVVRNVVADEGIFLRLPCSRFLADVKVAAEKTMHVDRIVNMAALPAYMEALRACGHKVPP